MKPGQCEKRREPERFLFRRSRRVAFLLLTFLRLEAPTVGGHAKKSETRYSEEHAISISAALPAKRAQTGLLATLALRADASRRSKRSAHCPAYAGMTASTHVFNSRFNPLE
jgi:hypothetical protein